MRIWVGVNSGESIQWLMICRRAGAESLAWGDLDDDGDPDLVVCDFQGRKILAYWNVGGGRFERVVEGPLATVSGGALVAAFGDYDNDGDLDLMVATGQANAQPNLLYRNEAGVLLRVDIGSPSSELARTGPVVFGDIDNDGDLDLFEGNMSGERDALYRNNGNSNQWLLVNLRGTTSNRSAIGARVVLHYVEKRVEKRQLRELFGGNRSQQDPRAHFGLGEYSWLVDVQVLWPSGSRQMIPDVAVDQILEVVEPFAPELAGHVLGEGRFELQFRMEGAKEYVIQESADLVIWTTVAVFTGNGDTVAWQDSAPAEEHCFYRVQPR
ncbi:MAG: CRTAC1 family protein [Limisphaerales bacterium]